MIINFKTEDKTLSVFDQTVPHIDAIISFLGTLYYVQDIQYKLEVVKEEGYSSFTRYLADVHLKEIKVMEEND
jgi:hypothetical protein